MSRRKAGAAAFVLVLLLAGIAFYFISTTQRDPMARLALRLDKLISPARIRSEVARLSAKPHRAGSVENHEAGETIIARLRSMNLAVSTNEHDVSIYEPLKQELYLIAPSAQKFDLTEKALPEDPYSKIAEHEIPYFAYSPDADVEAEMIYANFGTRDDYAVLKKHGIDVAGKIALVRGQGICRGMKAKIAAEEGVAGLLLYPELRDQGMSKAPFPKGPSLNPWTAQRGSLLQYFVTPGDPEHTRPTVPALPISAGTAEVLFRNLNGELAPAEWHGYMPVSYAMGPGSTRVRMVIRGELKTKKIRNIFASIRGVHEAEPHILLSGHYDAWVYGACDPCSGTATILETASVLSDLSKQGWKPRRTIDFAFWDAEEFGLIGSAKWTQQNSEQVRNIAAHLYVDSLRAKNFTAYITPGLRAPLDRTLAYVSVPQQDRKFSDVHGEYDLPGFSDDTAPMTGWAATPSARLGFGTYYSVYHSLYDDMKWMDEFCDPGFRYSAALVKILTLFTTELSDSAVLPFRMSEISAAAMDKLSNQNVQAPELEQAIESFDQSAKEFEERVQKSPAISANRATEINRLLLQIMQAFQNDSKSFADRNTLIGPSPEEGCAGELLPGLKTNDPVRIQNWIAGFRKAATVLQRATNLL